MKKSANPCRDMLKRLRQLRGEESLELHLQPRTKKEVKNKSSKDGISMKMHYNEGLKPDHFHIPRRDAEVTEKNLSFF